MRPYATLRVMICLILSQLGANIVVAQVRSDGVLGTIPRGNQYQVDLSTKNIEVLQAGNELAKLPLAQVPEKKLIELEKVPAALPRVKFFMGGGSTGGGDLECDAQIKRIASNLRNWYENNGPAANSLLDLSSTQNPHSGKPYTVSEFTDAMSAVLTLPLRSGCSRRSPSTPSPIQIGGVPKICKTRLSDGVVDMLCDTNAFLTMGRDGLTTQDLQIQQINHEFAILIEGLEPDEPSRPTEASDVIDISSYQISSQLAFVTVSQTVRMVIVMDPATARPNQNPLNSPGPHKITVEANFTTLSGNLDCKEDVSNIINRRITPENAICFQDIDYKFRAPDFFQVTIWDAEGEMPQTKIYNRASITVDSPKKLVLVFHIVTSQMSPEQLGFNFGSTYGAKGSSRNLWHFRILVDGQVIHDFIKGSAHENAGIMRLQ